ncbi:nose resistant to fluoxetine protein 6 isoform X2 [Drosophila montana]|uniref:nose resistant to fluoxetine protein 6 isoform X2 n=1 Tax=Drosophila montana TaxID=40370 RepID=UPI00313BF79B
MALEKVRLLLLLLLGLSRGVIAYSGDELLTWLQHSNLGYQVLQQAPNTSSQQPAELLCAGQVALLLQAADAHVLPALQVLDAWGKLPHGLLYGHFSDLGNYESCLGLSLAMPTAAAAVIETKYCLAHIQFEGLLPQTLDRININIGACVPATCSAAQLNRWLNNYLRLLFEDAVAPEAQLVQEANCALAARQPLAPLDWFAVGLLIFLAVLVILCTLLDYINAPQQMLGVFSLRQNLRQLFQISRTTTTIPCLHGIRCLTIIWIIYGHDYMFMLLAPNVNTYEVVAWAQTPYSMLLQSGSISVDTFFLLSGMLLVMATLRELDRQSGRLNVPLMYLHRIVRLTPVLAVAVLLFMTLYPRLDSGPLWQQFTSSYQLCTDTWWATLLYVQNYAAAGRMCLGHSWYLAVDMQLFLLSPLLLWPLWRWRRRAAAGIVVLVVLLFGCVFCIIMLNELSVFQRDGNLGGDSVDMRMIYYTTHARATPWLIGLLFGYFLHGERGKRRRLAGWLMQLLWLLALLLLVAVIWSVYPYTQPGVAPMTPLAGAFYLCCSRIAWPLALCWLIWACQSGRGGVVNTLLSWCLWQPISKLSYCLYIWHLLVEMLNTGRLKSSQHFSNYDAVLHFWSDFGITLLVSLAMYVCVEAPLVRLELHLLRRPRQAAAHPATPTVSMAVIMTPSSVSQQNLVEA